jgi:phosphatidylserine/phosphatidylglycerophosphate/cardiolipin synthase-like enzyme
MSGGEEQGRGIFTAVRETVGALDGGLLEALARQLDALPAGAMTEERFALVERIAPASARAIVGRLLRAWGRDAPELPPAGLAAALRAGENVDAYHRARSTMDLVWTGPAPAGTQLRRTDQALLETVAAARGELWLVSFVVHGAGRLQAALQEALDRGVRVRLALESSDECRGKVETSASTDLTANLVGPVERYAWPYEARPKVPGRGGEPHFGLLHAKCAVADDTTLFVSSANLTDHAMELNMELGLLIRGGSLPGEVRRHLEDLVVAGLLVRA